MAQELATQKAHQASSFSDDDVSLIKETVCRGATDTEFKLFLYQANKTGLNPLARQLFAVKRYDSSLKREVMSIQVSIDGFRLIAERTGHYAGQVGAFWCGDDGVWRDVWLSNKPPVAAKVGILRDDFKEPCWGVARFDAYKQSYKDKNTGEMKLSPMWSKMGDVMIAKCAESLALRKGFPQELSGLYTSDEMGQVAQEETIQEKITEQPTETKEQKDNVQNLVGFAKKYACDIGLVGDDEALCKLVSSNAIEFSKLKDTLPKWHERITQLLDEQRAIISGKAA